MLQPFPRWKYFLLSFLLVVGLIYAVPNLFGEDPAVQLMPVGATGAFSPEFRIKLEKQLEEAQLPFLNINATEKTIVLCFGNPANQFRAKELLSEKLGAEASVALHSVARTPVWLTWLGAAPMKLGLDLRGGVHFLMEVDVQAAITRRLEEDSAVLSALLRENKLRAKQSIQGEHTVQLTVLDPVVAEEIKKLIEKQLGSYTLSSKNLLHGTVIELTMQPTLIEEIRKYVIEQSMSTLRNRVNELGVSEAVVQRQGANYIVVELPGVQDPARAKEILGKTATLSFHLQATPEQNRLGIPRGFAPPGTKWFYQEDGKPYLLQKKVILTGDSIIGAMLSTDDRTGQPAVSVRVGGAGLALFKKTTLENVGSLLGVVYQEHRGLQEGESLGNNKEKAETLISIATIQSPLGAQFQITGFTVTQAQDLALLLRAGALPAAIAIVEERTIGPSLGAENIRLGVLSIEMGLALVVVVMLLYYSVFGLIANIALVFNVLLLIAGLSLLGATLTLPGMAGIVLTVGMAVDANVLIFERIREELRNGLSSVAAIHAGFEHALATIIDANLTTLIVGIMLFSVGSGPVKGFAVTLCLGILTSMITATMGTRALVHLLYGQGKLKMRIGI